MPEHEPELESDHVRKSEPFQRPADAVKPGERCQDDGSGHDKDRTADDAEQAQAATRQHQAPERQDRSPVHEWVGETEEDGQRYDEQHPPSDRAEAYTAHGSTHHRKEQHRGERHDRRRGVGCHDHRENERDDEFCQWVDPVERRVSRRELIQMAYVGPVAVAAAQRRASAPLRLNAPATSPTSPTNPSTMPAPTIPERLVPALTVGHDGPSPSVSLVSVVPPIVDSRKP